MGCLSVPNPLIRYAAGNPLTGYPFIRYANGNSLTGYPLQKPTEVRDQ